MGKGRSRDTLNQRNARILWSGEIYYSLEHCIRTVPHAIPITLIVLVVIVTSESESSR